MRWDYSHDSRFFTIIFHKNCFIIWLNTRDYYSLLKNTEKELSLTEQADFELRYYFNLDDHIISVAQ